MDDVLRKGHEAGLRLKSGAGIGYEHSTLRPRGAYVSGAGAYTSGPLSFMDIFDKMCFTVSSAGGRRGAQMGTFDVGHPDVMEFIRAKRESGRLRQFNLSLLITDEFMQAVREDREWKLAFPLSQREYEADKPDLKNTAKFVRSEEHTSELQSPDHLVCRLLLEKKKQNKLIRRATAHSWRTAKPRMRISAGAVSSTPPAGHGQRYVGPPGPPPPGRCSIPRSQTP